MPKTSFALSKQIACLSALLSLCGLVTLILVIGPAGGKRLSCEHHSCSAQDESVVAEPFTDASPDFFEVNPDGSLPHPETGKAVTSSAVGPIVPAATQPSGALSGRIVFTSAGHGWTYNNDSSSSVNGWYTQRGVTQEMNEDYGNLDQMNMFVSYCFNAGATVVAMRPIGYQTNQVVLDNDDAGVTFSGTWNNSSSTIFFGSPGDLPYRYASLSSSETATATYTPTIPVAGLYPVYTWVRHGSDRTSQLYRIRHTGGESQVRIPHHMVGNGWVYLGTYYFDAGSNSAKGAVVISNLQPSPSFGTVVIADAIRFGNGMGDVVPTPKSTETPTVSGYPREEECARYWVQRAVSQGQSTSIYNPSGSDANDNVGTPPRMAKEMNRQEAENLFKRIFIGFHSNAGGGRGTLGLYNNNTLFPGTATPNQQRLAQIIGSEVNGDMVGIGAPPLELAWYNRTSVTYARSDYAFGEIHNGSIGGEMDATIIEVAFHDDASDAKLLRDSKARNWAARACYHAVVKYMNEFDGLPLNFLPEPPTNVRAVGNANGNITLSWNTPAAMSGSGSATSYVVYRSTNGFGFGNPVTVSGGTTTSTTISGLAQNTDYYFRVAAVNAGGESFPSETVGCRVSSSSSSPKVLVVNGFTRFDRSTNLRQTPAARNWKVPGNSGTMERVLPRQVNAFEYVVPHGKSLAAAGAAFDSCQREAVLNNQVTLTSYPIVIWAAGQEATNVLNSTAQSRITTFLNGGGHLFISGSDVAWSLGRSSASSADKTFLQNYLRAAPFSSDSQNDSQTRSFSAAAASIFSGNPAGTFDDGTKGTYWVQYPDVLTPIGAGSTAAINYSGGTGGAAAIQYDGASGGGKVVFFAFPFETITSASVRDAYMADVVSVFTETLTAPAITSQPQSQTVAVGSNATFSVGATGSALSYQWRFNGTNIAGATANTYVRTNAQLSHAGNYSVVVSNSVGTATSANAVLTVLQPPVITSQPQSQSVPAGTTVNFTVTATGQTPLSYQWRKNGTNLINGGNVSGATSATLTLASVGSLDTGNYSVVVSNSVGSATSSAASLSLSTTFVFHDDFESGTMAYWTLNTTMPLVADNTRSVVPGSGVYSAKMTNSFCRMHRNIVGDNGGVELSGHSRVSWYIYDPGSASTATRIYNEVRDYVNGSGLPNGGTDPSGTLGQLLAAGKYNSVTMAGEVYDSTKYQGRVVLGSSTGWFNLNATGAPSRSTGWHKFEIERMPDGTTLHFYVDGVLSRTLTGATAGAWDTIILGPGVGGPSGTAGDAWIDGFAVEYLGGPPAIVSHPVSQTNLIGTTASFSVGATGNVFAYQWRKNGVNLPGATTSTLLLNNVQQTDAGAYDVLVQNIAGSTASATAVLTVVGPPVISQQPVDQTVGAGSNVVFSVVAGGSLPLAYQWLKNGTNLTDNAKVSGAGTATLALSGISQSDAGDYSVVVTNSAGVASSSNAVLVVVNPPVILVQPIEQNIPFRGAAQFTVSISGSEPLSLQWKRNDELLVDGDNISGAATPALTVSDVTQSDAGVYALFASNAAGSIASAPAMLRVIEPVILSHPIGSTNDPGTIATFTVAVDGTAPLNFQWKKNGTPLTNSNNISGADTETLIITDIVPSDAGDYSVLVSNDEGTALSQAAKLVVVSPPVILTQPASQTVPPNATVTFSVLAAGAEPLAYQWRKNVVDIPGATSSAYSISNATGTDAGSYSVMITNGLGSALSSNATLTIISDNTPPLITISGPAANATFGVPSISVWGAASDNDLVQQVAVSLNDGPFQPANGTASWSLPLTLVPGTNSVVARATDRVGNQTVVTRKFFYSVSSLLTLNVIGNGQVANPNGTSLLIGRGYKLTAFVGPGTNWIFTNWTDSGGTVFASNAVLSFIMQSNLVLNANFIPNPFITAAGTYSGLFHEPENVSHHSSGFFTLKVNARLGYSGKLLLDGNTVPFSGKFSVAGTANRTVSRAKFGKDNLLLTLALDFTGTDQISGTVGDGAAWSSALLGDRWVWSTNQPATLYSRNYTVALPGANDASAAPPGFGYGFVTVSPVGRVKVVGLLADGHRLGQGTLISKNGQWPLYVPLYVESKTVGSAVLREFQGGVLGWLTLSPNAPFSTNLAPQGSVSWIKKGWTNQLYANGFTNSAPVLGSRYLPPPLGVRVLNLSNGTLTFTHGNFFSPSANTFTLGMNNVVTIDSPTLTNLRVGLSLKQGTFKGSFVHPANWSYAPRFFGVVLQDQNVGRGFFLGTSEGGSAALEGN